MQEIKETENNKGKESFKIPMLTNSKPIMKETIIRSKRLPSAERVLPGLDIYTLQSIYEGLFNRAERQFVNKYWKRRNLDIGSYYKIIEK